MFQQSTMRAVFAALVLFGSITSHAAIGQTGEPPEGVACVVSAGNRNAPLAPDGSYTVFGIPGNLGAIRARATCADGSVGQSAIGFTDPTQTATIQLGPIVFGQLDPVPIAVNLSAPTPRLTTGQTSQMSLLAVAADGTSHDVTQRSAGTVYSVSNALMATVSEDGLVTIFPQFASGSSARVVASATAEGSVSSTFMFILGPRGTLRGRVLASDGVTPITDAEVSVLRLQPMEQAGTAITNAAGEFQLDDVNAGPFLISAIDPASGDRALTSARIENEGDDIQVLLRMNGLANVDVTVVDATEQPVAGALVSFTALGAYRDNRTLPTDALGIAHFAGVAVGQFTVSTRDPATRLVGTAVDSVSAGETLPVTLRLQPTGVIEGFAFDVDGTTLRPGIQVRILSRARGILTQMVTGADGAFSFDTLPISDGPFTLDAFVDGRLRARVPGIVISMPDETVHRDIVLSQVGTVSGVVKDPDGVVFAGARVTMQSLEGLRLTFDAVADNNGRFVLPAVPVGDFELTAVTETGRTGRATGRVDADAEDVVLDVVIANNTLVGTVYLRDDQTRAGAGITVYMAARALGARYSYAGVPGVLSAETDANGDFGFRVESAGSYYVQAEQDLERGRSEAVVINLDPSQPLESRVVFLAKGSVSGWVRDVNGVAQVDVPVVVRTEGAFVAEREIRTDATGHYSMPGVFAGDVSVRASNEITRLSGISRGRLNVEGEAIVLNVTLAASGTLSGRVIERDGSVVAGPVRLTVRRNTTVFTSMVLPDGGSYQFELVPLGDIELTAESLDNGDRGVATTRISSANESKVIDVRLVGQGQINVQLLDELGAPVAGARVTVATQRPFYSSKELISGVDGRVVFERVFAGDFTLAASKPAPVGALSGALVCAPAPNQNCVLLPSEVREINLTMTAQPIGAVHGTVFAPDGVTPVGAGMVVRMLPEPFTNAFVTSTDADGHFAYAVVPAGTYNIDVLNFFAPNSGQCPDRDRIRGRATGITVSTQNQVVESNVQLIGQGQVSGRVTNAGGNPVQGIEVELTNPDPVYGANVSCRNGTTFNQFTDANGEYLLADVPPGDFTITAENSTRTLRAEGRGRVAFAGDAVVVDLQLVDSAVALPYTFYDANGFRFDITGDGSIGSGTNNVFAPPAPDDRAERLEIVKDSISVPFTNGDGSVGRLSEGGQQLEVDDVVPAGLSVTRRAFVPRAGYFTRYLEILRNPGVAPVTVSVRLNSHHRTANSNPRVVDSSDGDQILSVAGALNRDRWVVLDDQQDSNPFSTSSIPATAHLFDGVGAVRQVGSASYSLIGQTGRLRMQWDDITVAPGETVILMHFTLNQLTRYSAREAALRLAQLPPEAIDDLTTDERLAIANFVVPEQSLIEPLPNLDAGVLTGRVFSGDGITPIAGANVRFKSQHVLFGRERFVTTNSTGAFAYRSTLDGTDKNYVIPVYGFELSAVYNRTGAATALTPGAFAANETQVEQDLIFVGQGDVRGAVKRHNAALLPGASVRLCRLNNRQTCTDESPNPSNSATSQGDGSYAMFASTPREYFLFANKLHPQHPVSRAGRELLGAGVVTITAGDTAVADVIMEETGSVAGLVRASDGTPVTNALVELWMGAGGSQGLGRETRSDTSGRFRFVDVPLGPHQLRAEDQISGAQGQADVAPVIVDTEAEQDVQLLGFGAVHAQVLFARGTPAGNAPVAPSGRSGGIADSNGRITFQLPEGSWTIVASHPDAPLFAALRASAPATIASNGEQVDVVVTLPPAGTVFGNIVRPDGTTLAGGFPYTLRQIRGGSLQRNASTSATGAYNNPGLPVGGYVITAYDANQDRFADAEFSIDEDGQEVEVNLLLLENRIALPATLRDANRFAFDVQHGGQLLAGSNAYDNAGVQLQVNGIAYAGETSARLDADRRQFIIAQPAPIAGLQVSRKIFVPRGAYFARYLEVLENPTAAPITAQVRLTSRFLNAGVQATSSGDVVVDALDHWITLDDVTDADILLDDGQTPALAQVFAQSGAAAMPNVVGFANVSGRNELVNEWTALEVPAGGRVTLLHFAVQQINRAGALAAARRLVDLPPEVLNFLTPEDLASIRNFAMPVDGVSLIEALPSLTASIDGVVYEGDVRTPVRSARVTVQSTHPLFNRVWGKQRDPNSYCPPGTPVASLRSVAASIPNPPILGSYALQGQLTADDSIAVPEGIPVRVGSQEAAGCFSYYAGHPFTRFPSRQVMAAPSVSQDVIFDTGILTGTINGAIDYSVTGGRLYRSIDDPDPPFPVYVPIASDATYVYPGLPPGTYDLLFDTTHPDGVVYSNDILRGQRKSVVVTLGAVTVTDVDLQPTGSVQGTVITFNGEQSVNARMQLEGPALDQEYDQCGSGCVPETLSKHLGKRRVRREVRSDSLGRYSFAAVPSGLYTLTVTDPISDGQRSFSVSVSADAVTVQNVTLLALGSAELTVLNPAGSAVADAYVHLYADAQGFEEVAGRTNGLGRLTIANIPQGNYVLRVRDPRHPGVGYMDRTVAGNIASSGQVNPHTVNLLAAASLSISVVDGDNGGLGVAGAQVSVTDVRGSRYLGVTNASGQITATTVPFGNYSVRASARVNGVDKEEVIAGVIANVDDGQTRAVSIDLRSALIPLPYNYYDANRMSYRIAQSGANPDLPRLTIDGNAFTGAATATQQLTKRQFTILQATPISGLKVSRKVHVPQNGYYARYLEVLENFTAAPIVVNVKTETQASYGWSVKATSSGDANLSNTGSDRDLWFTFGGGGETWALGSGDGLGVIPPAELAYGYSSSYGNNVATQIWNNVTVPAGGRTVLMHFAIRQVNGAGAQASAERLMQLPPEVMEGLVLENVEAIGNFDVPSDLLSALPPLPRLTGTVGGKVFEGDAVTAVSGAQVRVTSQHPLYNREWSAGFVPTLNASTDGSYIIAGVLHDGSQTIAIPVDSPVLVKAAHPASATTTSANAVFAPGDDVLLQDLVFASGQIDGRVLGGFQYPSAYAEVRVYRGNTYIGFVPTSADGSFHFGGLVAGTYRVHATLSISEGSDITGEVTSVLVNVGQTTVQDVLLEANGAISGRLLTLAGLPVASTSVNLSNGAISLSRNVTTNALGEFRFNAVPVGSHLLSATDARNGARHEASVVITTQQQTNQDLVFPGLGTADITVRFANGSVAPNVNVYARAASISGRRDLGTSDSNGLLTGNLPIGAFTIEADHPQLSARATLAGSIASDGEHIAMTLNLIAVAKLRLTVIDAAAQPVSGARVYYAPSAGGSQFSAPQTNASGQSLTGFLAADQYLFTAHAPNGQSIAHVFTVDAAVDGQIVEQTVTLGSAPENRDRFQFFEERHVQSVALSVGDRLSIVFNGAELAPYPAICVMRTWVYRPGSQSVANALGYGPPDFTQSNISNDVRNIVATESGNYLIAMSPYQSGCPEGGYRMSALVNDVPVSLANYPDAGSISGHLYQPDGVTPVAAGRVRLRTGGSVYLHRQIITDAAGAYSFTGVPRGGFTLSYVPQTGDTMDVGGWLDSNEALTQDIVIGATTRINVSVVGADSLPIGQASYVTFQSDSFYRSMYTAANGQASLTYVGNDPLVITAYHPTISGLRTSKTVLPDDGQTVSVTMRLAPVAITGSVRDAAGALAPSVSVYAYDAVANQHLESTQTDELGAFSFPTLASGTQIRFAASDPYNYVVASSVLTVMDAGNPPVELQLFGRGTAVFTAATPTGTPIESVSIYATYKTDLVTGDGNYVSAYTGSDGVATMQNLPVGRPITIDMYYYGGGEVPIESRTIMLDTDGQVLEEEIVITIPGGSVAVSVTATDGLDVQGACYAYFPNIGGGGAAAAKGSAFSAYGPCNQVLTIDLVPPGNQVMTVYGSGFFFESIPVAVADQVETPVNVSLSTVSGTVRYADGSEPESVYAYVESESGEGSSSEEGSGANYRVLNVRSGDFTLFVQDDESGLSSDAAGTMADLDVPVVINVVFPASGSVHGRVTDASGLAMEAARVYLLSSGLDFERYTETDAAGDYGFDHIALGEIVVHALSSDGLNLAAGTTELLAGGDVQTVDLQFPVPGLLSGVVRDAEGAVVPNSCVDLRSTQTSSGYQYLSGSVTANEAGEYTFSAVSPGRVWVTAEACESDQTAPIADGTVIVASSATSSLDLNLGSALRLPLKLEDSVSGFRFEIQGEGGAYVSVPPSGYNWTLWGATPELSVDGEYFGYRHAAHGLSNGRAVELGVVGMAGLDIYRHVYVPESAGYARWLDVFHNPGSSDITTTLRYGGSYARSTSIVAEGSNAQGGLFQLQSVPNPGSNAAGSVAYVLSGKTAGRPQSMNISGAQSSQNWSWQVSIPAGQTVAFLQYIAVRLPGQTSQAQTQAQALIDGVLPGMFDGLSAEERSQIQNFTVPQ